MISSCAVELRIIQIERMGQASVADSAATVLSSLQKQAYDVADNGRA